MLEQCGFTGSAEIETQGGRLIISPVYATRKGWNAAFETMASKAMIGCKIRTRQLLRRNTMAVVETRRFDIFLIALDPTIGSEITKTRPCVIISPDEMNAHIRKRSEGGEFSALGRALLRLRGEHSRSFLCL